MQQALKHMNKILLISVLISIFVFPSEGVAKKRRRIIELRKEEIKSIPVVLPVSEEFTTALAGGDVGKAIRVLRMESASYKSLHLLREAQKIVEFDKKEDRIIDKHQTYQNLAIAYHNLYLFLLKQGVEQKSFFKNALHFYKKSRASRSKFDQSETAVLMAGLFGVQGDINKAKRYFKKANSKILESSYRGAEYLALYYAAIGDVYQAVTYLKKTHLHNPDKTTLWVAIGDDFFKIEKEPVFLSLLDEWKIAKMRREPVLSVPRPSKPALSPR